MSRVSPAVQAAIDDFLQQKRIAIVGVSRNEKDFTRSVFREFQNRGYDVLAVNPLAGELEGARVFARVKDIQPPPDAVLLMTPSESSEAVVRDCLDAGIRRVWMHRSSGTGATSERALALCRANGLSVIPGECPMMFLPNASWIHGVHRWLRGVFS